MSTSTNTTLEWNLSAATESGEIEAALRYAHCGMWLEGIIQQVLEGIGNKRLRSGKNRARKARSTKGELVTCRRTPITSMSCQQL